METINTLEIIQAIKSSIMKKELYLGILEKVESVVKKFEGKQINKRIETAIKAALPEYTIYYGKTYTWHEIRIWGNNLGYEHGLSINLGYVGDNDNKISMQSFYDKNQSYYLERGRIEYLEKFLDGKELNKLVGEYNAIQNSIADFKKLVPTEYPISGFFKL